MRLSKGIVWKKGCVLSLLGMLVVACAVPSNSKAGSEAATPQELPGAPAVIEPPVGKLAEVKKGELLRHSYHACASSNDGSTWAMQECVETEFKYQDSRLNAAYKKLLSKLRPDEEVKLRDDEKRWIAQKESACAWDAGSEGQAQRIAANVCALEKTAERAAYLEGKL